MKVSFSDKQKGGLHLKYLKFNEYQMADCRHCLWMKEFPKSWCWLVSQHKMGVLYACHNPLLQTLHVAGTWFTFSFSQLVFNWREWANIRYGNGFDPCMHELLKRSMKMNVCTCHRSVDSIWTDELNVRSSDDMVSSDATSDLITSSDYSTTTYVDLVIKFYFNNKCMICIEDINITDYCILHMELNWKNKKQT